MTEHVTGKLAGILDLLGTEPTIAECVEDARAGVLHTCDITAPTSLRAFLTAELVRRTERTILLVTSTYREAEEQVAALQALLGHDLAAYYPAWETLPHERLSPRSDTVGRRMEVLRRLAGKDERPAPRVVVAPVRAVLQPQVAGLADIAPVRLRRGEDHSIDDIAEALVAAAYLPVDMVQRRGEFAVRGGIVDVFPPVQEHPVRIDFFGDTVDDMRYFMVADQRSTEHQVDEVVCSPCRELLMTPQVRARAEALVADHPELTDMLDRIAEGLGADGMESLAPALVDRMELLVDVLPADAMVLVADPELVRGRASDLVATSEEFLQAGWAAAASGGRAPIDLRASGYQPLGDVRSHVLELGQSWWTLAPFAVAPDEGHDSAAEALAHIAAGATPIRTIRARDAQSWAGDIERAVAEISAAVRTGWRVVMSAEGHGTTQRLAELLAEHDVAARVVEDVAEPPVEGVVELVTTGIRHGFLADGVRLAVWTAGDLSGRAQTDRVERKMPGRRKKAIDPLELKPGDPVVHEHHGVGRYVEMIQRTVAGATRDYMVIEYAASKKGQPGDRVFVPMEQLDQVTRYVGGETPVLDKMGGSDWAKRKSRARSAVKEIAGELVRLYAARRASKGFAFSPDSTMQRELEDAFDYTETPDQLSAIDEVKSDMEQTVPMDRLICGDVGYGKTEIAVRAAFKAVMDSKQVAILVPTTLLVTQHYNTFSERYAGFPIRVAALSRFQTEKESRQVIEDLSAGRIDVIVGTHRLLSQEIVFKDLGLVIIDEEQRFGVEHKEQLKKLRMNVDVLAMSATPIPRTLEMAITGIREMSTIATPPEERHPVLTFAGAYDEGQVTAAIRRELLREGQVFFVHNRVQTIDKAAARIRELVPEARVVIAHGQMGERRLEQVMLDFWERRADVLVATTIVEAGLDIASANTLIVDRADRMGLSQLHQLRGRVGRSRERGYCYFLYPADKPLSQEAHDRLATLAANTDIGAGMAIATKDLEMRGAGNLLGGEQSGHIADVGFDLYIRLVGEAVANYRGDRPEEAEPDTRIELPVDAHLPEDYIGSERLRLEMYKTIAEVRSDADIAEVRAELQDRYGPLPEPVETLLEVARFRLIAKAAGLREVIVQGSNVRFSPVQLPESRQLKLARLYPRSVYKTPAGQVLIPRPATAPLGGKPLQNRDLLAWAVGVVRDLLTVPAPPGEAQGSGGDVGTSAGTARARAGSTSA
ncbi:transcription-repair coupling factor [Raineyella antarctica]|uniref:Transcription-repair-coupling factor n=1 Tax=Raineyella antarctica TaxID=1577474 RepID=A0A1G6GDK4_9ACTN|nr:transcription-repair coupling factor [Raineyella antarctica]SDB79913.1 transcription-repair coupling factor [Raineyella antarctica]